MNHLVWRVVKLNEGSGFRLQIDRICSSRCTYTCEVNVKFVYASLLSSKGHSSYEHFYDETTEYTLVGSWNDAAAYCRDRGERLVSPYLLYHMAKHDSTSMAHHIPWRHNGVDLMENAFYAALHKPTEVSSIGQPRVPGVPHFYDSCNINNHTINRAAFVCLSVCLSVCLFPISSEVL